MKGKAAEITPDREPLSQPLWCDAGGDGPAERFRRIAALWQVCARLFGLAPNQRPKSAVAFSRSMRMASSVRSYTLSPVALAEVVGAPQRVLNILSFVEAPCASHVLESCDVKALGVSEERWRKCVGDGNVLSQAQWFVNMANVNKTYSADEILASLCSLGLLKRVEQGDKIDCTGITLDACQHALPPAPSPEELPRQPWECRVQVSEERDIVVPSGCFQAFLARQRSVEADIERILDAADGHHTTVENVLAANRALLDPMQSSHTRPSRRRAAGPSVRLSFAEGKARLTMVWSRALACTDDMALISSIADDTAEALCGFGQRLFDERRLQEENRSKQQKLLEQQRKLFEEQWRLRAAEASRQAHRRVLFFRPLAIVVLCSHGLWVARAAWLGLAISGRVAAFGGTGVILFTILKSFWRPPSPRGETSDVILVWWALLGEVYLLWADAAVAFGLLAVAAVSVLGLWAPGIYEPHGQIGWALRYFIGSVVVASLGLSWLRLLWIASI